MAWRNPRHQRLSGHQFCQTGAAYRLHVHKNILCRARTADKAITFQAVEPFHNDRFQRTGSRHHHVGVDPVSRARGGCFRVGTDGGGQIDSDDAAGLTAAVSRHYGTGQRRAFGQGTAADVANQAEVDKHVAAAVLRHEKTIAAHRIEPFDRAADDDFVLFISD